MAKIQISGMCALWPWPWIYDLKSRSWHTLESWITIVWNIIHIQHGSEELWPGNRFWVCVHCDLGDMTLGQVHDTSMGHGQKLCEILSRSDMAVRSYGAGTDFRYVCTVTLTLEVWHWVKVMTILWVKNNNYVKSYLDPTWKWGVLGRTQILGMCALWLDLGDMILGQGHDTPLGHGQQLCEVLSRSNMAVRSYGPDTIWTDGQTGWFLYTPHKVFFFFFGGGGAQRSNQNTIGKVLSQGSCMPNINAIINTSEDMVKGQIITPSEKSCHKDHVCWI